MTTMSASGGASRTASCISARCAPGRSRPRPAVERRRPGDEHHARAAPRRLCGHRVAHPAARPIADVADVVDVLVASARRVTTTSRPRSDPAGRRMRSAASDDRPQARRAGPCRSSRTRGSRRPDRRTARRGLRASPCCAEPRRARACWCSSPAPSAPARAWRDTASVRKSSAMPLRELADDVGGGGRDEQERRCSTRARCARCRRWRPGANWSVMTRPTRDRFERDLPDELARRARHDRHDVVAALLQPARDLDGLVGADAAGHAERDQDIANCQSPNRLDCDRFRVQFARIDLAQLAISPSRTSFCASARRELLDCPS